MKKYRGFYFWGFYFLLALSISAIVSFGYHLKTDDQDWEELNQEEVKDGQQVENKTVGFDPPRRGWGRYFRDELGLDQQQHEAFRDYRREYHNDAHELAGEMDVIRDSIMKELGKADSDTAKLNKLAQKMGDMHEALKQLTNHYYLNMKNVLDETQQEKLYDIFQTLNNAEYTGTMPGQGRGNQEGPHHGGHGNESGQGYRQGPQGTDSIDRPREECTGEGPGAGLGPVSENMPTYLLEYSPSIPQKTLLIFRNPVF